MTPNGNEEVAPSIKERVDDEVAAVYARHGYVIDGEPTPEPVRRKVFALVSQAVVDKRADRGKIAVRRHALVADVFPQVPGPDAWAEQDDPELAELVWKRLDGTLWKLCDMGAGGAIQRDLNGDGTLILCRTQATPDKSWAVYVTEDWPCLLADFSGPQKDTIKRAVRKFAVNLGMATERLPGYADRFKRELNSGVKVALESGNAELAPALEAAKATEDGDGE